MLTIDGLREYGANVEEGISRCINSESLYLNLVTMARDEKNFAVLDNAINEGDLNRAFEAAHALKGVLGNLSLTPMYDKAVEITELLRRKEEADYRKLVDELLESKTEFEKLFD